MTISLNQFTHLIFRQFSLDPMRDLSDLIKNKIAHNKTIIKPDRLNESSDRTKERMIPNKSKTSIAILTKVWILYLKNKFSISVQIS
jgi:hypothetical protein